ncbi:glycoside hydrolase family 1 protein [Thozetella sp. PMI_491]|nr:glycoside hydrolase family 1 protein [Thozetella sp. PMI_491]
MWSVSILIAQAAAVAAQQVYVSANGYSPRPYCTTAPSQPLPTSPTYTFTPFSYTLTQTVRTATAVSSAPATTYGPSYRKVSCLLGNLSTTSWGDWDPGVATTTPDTANPYGNSAFSALWAAAGLNVTRGIYSTTVSPTPVPTSELVLPPALYFGPGDCYSFPEGFMLGVSGAAAQIEGAVAQEGRAPAIPDFFEEAGQVFNPRPDWYSSDFAATENYFLYKQDIERLAAIGIKYYSFSIPWARILPFSLPGTPVNSQALQHYSDLIDFVLQKGMVPVVTLIHFDTPAVYIGGNFTGLLQRTYLGRVNCAYQADGFVEGMVNYGKIVMSHFADRVPIWITFNEPQWGAADGIAVDNVLKSHAQLYHFYKDVIKGAGRVSMKMGAIPGVPQNPLNQSHIDAAQRYTDLWIGSLLDPLVYGKDYPEAYKKTIQNYVELSPSDLEKLNGTIDFLALDIYQATAYYPVVADVEACAGDNSTTNTLYPNCIGATETTLQNWPMGDIADNTYNVYNTAPYLRTQIGYMWNTYKLPIVVTEFGHPSAPSSSINLPDIRNDMQRSNYYLSYLTEILKCIWEDGVDVQGAFMWSFVDNWEWGTYYHQFGLQYVNRTSQERSYRRSLFDVVDFVESRRMGPDS